MKQATTKNRKMPKIEKDLNSCVKRTWTKSFFFYFAHIFSANVSINSLFTLITFDISKKKKYIYFLIVDAFHINNG